MKLKIVCNDNIINKNFKQEHGFSVLINDNILFDTGIGDSINFNIRNLNIKSDRIKSVVLSHNHNDHTGGLDKLNLQENTKIFCGKDFFYPRFKLLNTNMKRISLDNNLKDRCEVIDNKYKLEENIYLLRIINKQEYFSGTYFYYKNKNYILDDFKEELAVVIINKKNKLDILTGCCHSGIKNLVYSVEHNFENYKINSIIGGLHLKDANEFILMELSDYLNKKSIKIFPGHCTGRKAIDYFKNKNVSNEIFAEQELVLD